MIQIEPTCTTSHTSGKPVLSRPCLPPRPARMAEVKADDGAFDALAASPKLSGVPKPPPLQKDLIKWGATSLPNYVAAKGCAKANDPPIKDREYWSQGFILEPPDELRCHRADIPPLCLDARNHQGSPL